MASKGKQDSQEDKEMVCTSITEREEFILYRLYASRCFTSRSGYHNDKLESLFSKKFPGKKAKKEFEDAIQCLLNLGYITKIGKSPPKYYISNKGAAIEILLDRGYHVTRGREHKI